jgi:hypothetical protein
MRSLPPVADGPAQSGEPTLLPMLVAATLGFLNALGPARLSRLLDAVAEGELFDGPTVGLGADGACATASRIRENTVAASGRRGTAVGIFAASAGAAMPKS